MFSLELPLSDVDIKGIVSIPFRDYGVFSRFLGFFLGL